jgi:hypothetical protein
MESGHTQCPMSLLDEAPSEGEGKRGVTIDFAQIGCVRLRKMKQSSICEPVMIRPVTWRDTAKYHRKSKYLLQRTVAVMACIESPRSASTSSWPLIFSFSKNVGSDLDDLALLLSLSVSQGLFFPSEV